MQNRHERRAKARHMLETVKKLRTVLALMRANPNLPHMIESPTGEVIDALDGETDRFLDQLEAFALADLGKPMAAGRA